MLHEQGQLHTSGVASVDWEMCDAWALLSSPLLKWPLTFKS